MTQIYDLERSGQAGVHPRFRIARSAARRTRSSASRACTVRCRTGTERQPRLLRIRHVGGRRRPDRRPRQAAERAEGADRIRTCSIRRSARLDLPPNVGAHTVFPVLRVEIPEFGRHAGRRRPRLSGHHQRIDRQRMPRSAADGVVRRHHGRVEAVRRVELDGPRSERKLLRPRRALRHALVERELHADLLQAA